MGAIGTIYGFAEGRARTSERRMPTGVGISRKTSRVAASGTRALPREGADGARSAAATEEECSYETAARSARLRGRDLCGRRGQRVGDGQDRVDAHAERDIGC